MGIYLPLCKVISRTIQIQNKLTLTKNKTKNLPVVLIFLNVTFIMQNTSEKVISNYSHVLK